MSSSSSTGLPAGDDGYVPQGLSAGLIVWGVFCFLVTLAFNTWLIRRYQRPNTPYAITGITWLAWLCAFVIVFLVPLDVEKDAASGLEPVWAVIFWTGFICTWCLLPMIQEYYDNGGFTFAQKFRLACRQNLILLSVALVVVFCMCLYLVIAENQGSAAIATTFKTLSNLIGLLLLIILGGYGLVEFPRMLYHSSHRSRRRDLVYYQATANFHEANETRDEFMELLKLMGSLEKKVAAQHDATLRAYLDEMKESMRPKEEELRSRGYKASKCKLDIVELMDKKARLDSHDLIKVNHQLRKVIRHLWLVDQLWQDTVEEAFHLEAELAESEAAAAGGRPGIGENAVNQSDLEAGAGSALQNLPGMLHISSSNMSWYRRVFYPRFLLVASIVCACTSLLMLFCELSIPIKKFNNVDVSPFSKMVQGLKEVPLIQQIFTVSLMGYFVLCTVYPLFKLRLSSFYYLGKNHSDTNSLVYNATIILRVSIALAYNFTLLLDIETKGLGDLLSSIQDVPFLGGSFNDIFPIFMLIWSFLVASNIIGRLMTYCNVERFQFITASAGMSSKDMSDAQIEARGQISEGRQLVKAEKRKRDQALAAGESFEFHASMATSPTNTSRVLNGASPPTSSLANGASYQPPTDRAGGLSGYKGRVTDKKEVRSARDHSSSTSSLTSSLSSDGLTDSVTSPGGRGTLGRLGSMIRGKVGGAEDRQGFLGGSK